MKNTANSDIKIEMKEAGLTFKQMAEILNMSEPTLYRIFSEELEDSEKESTRKIIEEYRKGRGEVNER